MNKKKLLTGCLTAILFFSAQAKEYHVSVKGDDKNTGTSEAPFRTISHAAQTALPGDVITVHQGTYREWVNPPVGGTDNENRIVYRAAPGEEVKIKGSEQITGWVKEKDSESTWKVVIPNSFFGSYNPYTDLIEGDWFNNMGRIHHTGEVFLNEKSLYEKESLEKVLHPSIDSTAKDPEGTQYTWYCENDGTNTIIWANFHKYNPNKELVEISVRPTCFYPEKKGINYITLKGFHISQAATQWAAPTAEQIGMVAVHWNKGWIIENNIICNSKCNGITLGKERDSGHNVWSNDPSIDGSLHYIEVTFRAIRNGWNKENIGGHIVRNNTIFNCEQTGICGSMGAAFSIIENNHIYDIWTKRQFNGAEIGGIKFHAAVDAQIVHNRIHNTGRGVWLDWMTQGTRVSRNLFYNNDLEDIFLEVNHGPFIIDNNICCSPVAISEQSQGGAYIHNLFLGKIYNFVEYSRYTPYFLPHSTDVAGLSIIPGGDDRYINNVFAPAEPEKFEKVRGNYGLCGYNKAAYPMLVEDNVYFKQAVPFANETRKLDKTEFSPNVTISEEADGVYLAFELPEMEKPATKTVNTDRLGTAKLPRQHFEQPDGKPIEINIDFFGIPRSEQPSPGPIENIKQGNTKIKIW